MTTAASRYPVDLRRALGCDVDVFVSIDVEEFVDVGYDHAAIEPARHRARRLALRDAVVEKFKVHALVRARRPAEEQAWDA